MKNLYKKQQKKNKKKIKLRVKFFFGFVKYQKITANIMHLYHIKYNNKIKKKIPQEKEEINSQKYKVHTP